MWQCYPGLMFADRKVHVISNTPAAIPGSPPGIAAPQRPNPPPLAEEANEKAQVEPVNPLTKSSEALKTRSMEIT